MIRFPAWRSSAILLLTAGLLAGCATYGQGVYRPSDRAVVRAPIPHPSSARVYQQADRDARNYVRTMSRNVRLSSAQQRIIHDRLSHRAHVLLERSHPRDHRYIYPFPRRVNEHERAVQRFWRDADRDIERQMNSSQRRAYRDFVRHHYERSARLNQRRHPHGGPPGQRRR